MYRISPAGEVSVFFRGLGRPQGLAFDRQGNLYVAASLGGKRGIVRLTPQAEAEVVLGGSNIVGLRFSQRTAPVVATNSALFTVDWDVEGLPLNGVELDASPWRVQEHARRRRAFVVANLARYLQVIE